MERWSARGRAAIVAMAAPAAVAAPAAGRASSVRAEGVARPDTFLARVEALAAIETLNTALLASPSATTTLERWCGGHAIATPAMLKAQRVPGAPRLPPTEEQRRRLGVGPDEPVAYRSVTLSCGPHVLSRADNWYVPARLSPAMNQALDTTDTSFGRVVAPLRPTRQTIAATLLWRPLRDNWEMSPPPADHPDRVLDIPAILFEHRAVLSTAERVPFCEVVEHYTSEVLAFGPEVASRRP